MKLRKLLALIAIFVVFVATVAVKIAREKSSENAPESDAAEWVTFNKELEFSAVQKITLTRGFDDKTRIILLKKDNEWTMPIYYGLAARKSLVEELIKKMTAMRGELRSDAEGVLTDFKIDDSQGLHVILEGADAVVLSHVVLSLQRPGRSGNFARLSGSPTVMVSKEDLLMLLGFYADDSKLDPKDFADFKVASFEPSKVNRLELHPKDSKSGPLTLVKAAVEKEAVWNFEPAGKNETVDASKVNAYLANAAGLYAKEALDPALTAYGFTDRPLVRISGDHNGKAFEVSYFVGNALPDKTVYLKVMPSGNVYGVHEGNLETLSKKDKPFFLKPKPAEEKK